MFAQAGARVAIVARHAEQAEAAAGEIGHGAFAVAGDVTSLASMESAMKSVAARNGGIDVLCANAGIFPQARLEEMTSEQWDEVMDTNLKGTFHAVKAAVPYLKKSDQGRIVLTSSITGPVTGFPGLDALRRHQGRAARLHAHGLHRAGEVRHHRQRGHARQHRDRRP